MELYKEIIAQYLSEQKAQIVFPDLQLNAKEIVELRCYQALQRIRAVVQDYTLDDDACFERIEEIVCTLEDIGSDGGPRHDFG